MVLAGRNGTDRGKMVLRREMVLIVKNQSTIIATLSTKNQMI
jgi:hypothetical protein